MLFLPFSVSGIQNNITNDMLSPVFWHPVNCQTIYGFFVNFQNILTNREIVPIFAHNSRNCLTTLGNEKSHLFTRKRNDNERNVPRNVAIIRIMSYSRKTHLNGSFSHYLQSMVYLYIYTIKTPLWGKIQRFMYALLHRYINTTLFTYFSSFLYLF